MKNPPCVWITFPLEGPPLVRTSYRADPGEEARMIDWLEAHPEWLALIGDAISLSKRARSHAA